MNLFNWFKKNTEPLSQDGENEQKIPPRDKEDPKVQFLNELKPLEDRQENIEAFSKHDIDVLKEMRQESRHWIKDLHVELDQYRKEFNQIENEADLLDGNSLNSAKGRSLDQAIENVGFELFGHYDDLADSSEKVIALQMKLDHNQEKFQADWNKNNEPPSKTPFTKDDVIAKEGEFDKLQDLLKDDQLHADMARAAFYCSPHSPEDIEYAEDYEDKRYAEFELECRENEIEATKGQINDMNQTLDDNHNKLNTDWNKSNEMDQGFELER